MYLSVARRVTRTTISPKRLLRRHVHSRSSSNLRIHQHQRSFSSYRQCRSITTSSPSSSSFSRHNRHRPTQPLLTLIHSRHRFASLPEHEVIGMPALSPSVEESKIVEWHKNSGDFVAADEAIAKVQTDKAELDWQVTDDIYLAKILLEPGVQVPVGTPVCIFVEEKADIAAFADYEVSSTAATAATDAPASAPAKEETAASSSALSGLPDFEAIGMPALSPTATDGAIVEWLVKEGDFVEEGSGIAEIQTDKSVVTWTSTDELYVARLLHPASADNKLLVGVPLAVFVEDKKDIAAFKDVDVNLFLAPASPEPSAPASPAEQPQAEPAKPAPTPVAKSQPQGDGARQFASPYAKKLAAEMGVDISSLAGSGPRGRVVALDVAAAQSKQASKSAEPAVALPKQLFTGDRTYEDTVASSMREIIGQRLWESKTTSPHFYVCMECEIDSLLEMRKQMNSPENVRATKTKISVNDFIIKACAAALQEVPEVNQSWLAKSDKNKKAVIRRYNYVDVSVAVATEGGLITPIIKDANLKNLSTISMEIKDLATRARNNKLLPDEFQGGTFTISNMGMYGVNHFTAIINPPQSAILAIGGAFPTMKPDAANPRGFRTCTTMTVTLSSDHRSVDGAIAAKWVNAFKKYIQQPGLMLY